MHGRVQRRAYGHALDHAPRWTNIGTDEQTLLGQASEQEMFDKPLDKKTSRVQTRQRHVLGQSSGPGNVLDKPPQSPTVALAEQQMVVLHDAGPDLPSTVSGTC